MAAAWQKVPAALLHSHSVQGLYGNHLAGYARAFTSLSDGSCTIPVQDDTRVTEAISAHIEDKGVPANNPFFASVVHHPHRQSNSRLPILLRPV